MNDSLRGGQYITFVCLYLYVCVCVSSGRAQAVNELLNHTIDQPFLPDTRWDRGQLNGLFGDSHYISPTPSLTPLLPPLLLLVPFPPLMPYCFLGGLLVFLNLATVYTTAVTS